MIVLFLSWIYIAWLSLSFGVAVLAMLGKHSANTPKVRIDEKMLTGLLCLSTIGCLLNFIIPLDGWTQLGMVAMGMILTIQYRNNILIDLQRIFKAIKIENSLCLGVGLFIFFLLIWNGAQPTKLYDSGLYHVQAVKWIKEFAVVPGLGNLHTRLAYNSHFFILSALFSNIDSEEWALLPLNSFFLLVLAFRLLVDIRQAGLRNEKEDLLLKVILLILSLFFLRSSINSLSTDIISSVLVLYALIIFREMSLTQPRFEQVFIISLIVFSSITFKLSTIFIGLLIIPFILKLTILSLSRLAVILILVVVPFAGRNIILSGYPLYPVSNIPSAPVDWAVPREIVAADENFIKASPLMAAYPDKFAVHPEKIVELAQKPIREWVFPWFLQMTLSLQVALLVNVFSILLLLISLLKGNQRYSILFVVVLINLALWFLKAPDPRFVFGFLIFGFALSAAYFFHLSQLLKSWFKYFKLIFVPVILLTLSYLTFQDVSNSSLSFKYAFTPPPFKDVETIKVSTNGGFIYMPIKIATCWGEPLPCTPEHHFGLELRGQDLKDGFRISNTPSLR